MTEDSKPYQLRMSAEQLLARARELTGIDLVDEAAIEPLTVLLSAYNTDACLHK